MATRSAAGSGIRWYSWLGLVGMIALGALLFFFTHAPVVASWLRWAITLLWVLVTLGLGVRDFVVGGDTGRRMDTIALDDWTFSHGGAGLVFGIWYMPLAYVLVLVLLWEVFEWLAPGFGEKESLANRSVDVGIALVLWLVVVLMVSAATDVPVPLVTPAMR